MLLDNQNKCNKGYAFINFYSSNCIVDFVATFCGKKWRNFNSNKVCQVGFAKFQGKKEFLLSQGKKMNKNRMAYYSDGEEDDKLVRCNSTKC